MNLITGVKLTFDLDKLSAVQVAFDAEGFYQYKVAVVVDGVKLVANEFEKEAEAQVCADELIATWEKEIATSKELAKEYLDKLKSIYKSDEEETT